MAKQAKLALGLDLKDFKSGIADAKKSIQELEKKAAGIAGGQGGGQGGRAGYGGGGGGGGISMGGLTSGPMKLLGMLGLSVGIQQAFSRTLQQSQTGLGLRALTGGTLSNQRSQYGFTRQERYERGTQIAQGAGRNLNEQELNKFVESSEKLQRSFGISGESYSGSLGAARKAGVRDQDKFIAGAVGDAVAAGMSGSAVGEYLSQMTGYLESMSKGIDIDDSSLRGMAGALGQMDFFKKDPSRIFDALRGIEAAFKDADPYQQYLSYRSINAAGGGNVSPAGVEMRRRMSLFGKIDEKTAQSLRDVGLGASADVMGISGEEMVRQRAIGAFRDANLGQKNLSPEQQLIRHQQFSAGMGLSDQQSSPILTQMMRWVQSGKKVEDFKLTKADEKSMQDAMKTADDLAKENMKSFQGKVVILGERLDNLKNVLSDFITNGVSAFVNAVDDFSKFTGLFQSDVSKLLAGLAAASGVGLGSKAIGGLGAGAMAGAAGAATGAGMLIGAASAAAIGVLIGEGIRSVLDEYFDWNNKTSKLWNGVVKMFGGEGENTGYMDLEDSLKEYGSGGRKAQAAYSKGARGRGFNLSPEGLTELIDREREAMEDDSNLDIESFREKQLEKMDSIRASSKVNKWSFFGSKDRSNWFAPGNVSPINEAKGIQESNAIPEVSKKIAEDIVTQLPTGTGDSVSVISENTRAIRQLTSVLNRISSEGGSGIRIGKGNK